jgi:hypothetical protein
VLVAFASISRVVFGPRTKAFHGYNWRLGRPWQCVSFFMEKGTIDLEFFSDQEYLTWVQSILLLIPKNCRNPAPGRILWSRAILKSVTVSLREQIKIEHVWRDLARSAHRDCQDDVVSIECLYSYLQ